MIFKYNMSDLPLLWKESVILTEFSKLLKLKWDEIHNTKRIFRYKIDMLEDKVINCKYLLQLNPDRGSKRRYPEHIETICQAFDPRLFNFTKVSDEELIMNVINENDDKHSILVNVSPISRYHSLICPFINKCLPQVITVDSLRFVLEIMFLCQDRDVHIGFNSLCALASVNHLHYHILLETHTLPAEVVECIHIAGELYKFVESYPVPAFCFQLKYKADIVRIAENVFVLIKYLLTENIAHNMLIARGNSVNNHIEEVIRIMVWPRKSSHGVKQLQAFNVAVCELSGWFPVFNKDDFNNIQQSDLEKEMRKWKINNFDELCSNAKLLFTDSTEI